MTVATVTVADFSVTLTADNTYTAVVDKGLKLNLSSSGGACVDGDYYFDLVVSLYGFLKSATFGDTGVITFVGLQVGALPGCYNAPGDAGPVCFEIPSIFDTGFIIFNADEDPLVASGTTNNTITTSAYPSPATDPLAYGGTATYSFAGGVCGAGACIGTGPTWMPTHDVCEVTPTPCIDCQTVPDGFAGASIEINVSGLAMCPGFAPDADGTFTLDFDPDAGTCQYFGTWTDLLGNVMTATINCGDTDGNFQLILGAGGGSTTIALGQSIACCIPCGLSGSGFITGCPISITTQGCAP